MKCPVDDAELQMTERQGVEIDYCPKCRGVWLDRGELDKILERSQREMAPAPPPAPAQQPPASYPPPGGYRRHDDDDDYRYGKKRKKSFLQEIFD